VHYLLLAFEFARQAERRQLQLEVMSRDAELRALRAQLDPHFLYNSLNSISALTTVDPAGARRMCVLLADFLRDTLAISVRDRIPLADELALTDRFLSIEQVRFGERLQIERHVDAAATHCRVPPLLLQAARRERRHSRHCQLAGGRPDPARRRSSRRPAVDCDRNPRDVDAREPSRRGRRPRQRSPPLDHDVRRQPPESTRGPIRVDSASRSRCPATPMTDTPAPRLRVAIVDDEALARAVLREYLSPMLDVEIVAECANGFEAVKVVAEQHPICCFSTCRCRNWTALKSSSWWDATWRWFSSPPTTSTPSARSRCMPSTTCSSRSARSVSPRR
jgi:hypothetical protein